MSDRWDAGRRALAIIDEIAQTVPRPLDIARGLVLAALNDEIVRAAIRGRVRDFVGHERPMTTDEAIERAR